MQTMSYAKKAIITAVCIALCAVLPMAFHAIPRAGQIYLPIHIPVLLCGLICGWHFGLLCGLAGPVFSMLTTHMPRAPYLPPMMLELAVYGLVAGLVLYFVHTRVLILDLYISLISAMLAGRVVAGIAKALIFAPGKVTMNAWVTSYFIKGIPGIIIQLAILPAIVYALYQAKLIPARYSKK